MSENTAKLHSEVTSLRKENKRMGATLQNLSNEVEELKESMSEVIAEDVAKGLKKSLHKSLTDSMQEFSQDMEYAVSEAVRDRIYDMESSVQEAIGDAITTAVSEGLQGAVEEGLEEAVSTISDKLQDSETTISEKLEAIEDAISKQGAVLRSDMARVHRPQDGSSSLHSGLRGQEDEFTLFSRLPPELRLKIWKIACFNSPAVTKMYGIHRETWLDFGGFRCPGYRIPAVLQTCRESRCEALNWYERRSLRNQACLWQNRKIDTYAKYFNFAVDIFYLDVMNSLEWDLWTWVELIHTCPQSENFWFRRVAVSLAAFNMIDWEEDLYCLLKPESKIDEIIIVMNASELSKNAQHLVPTEIVSDADGHLSLPDDGWAPDYIKKADSLAKKIRKITKMAKEAVDLRSAESGNKDSHPGNALPANEQPHEQPATTETMPETASPFENSINIISAAATANSSGENKAKNNGEVKLWPDFTMMTFTPS